MSGAFFILAINLCVAGLLAAVFGAIALYDRKVGAAVWIAAGYGVLGVNFATEFVIARYGSTPLAVVFSFAAVLAAMMLVNAGLAAHTRSRAPWRAMAAIFCISVVVCYAIQDMPRTSFWRMFLYQAPYAAMQFMAMAISLRTRPRRRLDLAVTVLLGLSGLQFLAKPFLLVASGGTGATPAVYLTTTYAMLSQTMGTIFAITLALLMLSVLVRDMLLAATEKAERDPLSGLLNRGGFERLAELACRASAERGVPPALVTADLDRFKSVNDTFGHASGDMVIRVFARLLALTAGEAGIVGRLGGEEFAVMLPHADLAAARLFAEGARTAFSSIAIPGLPPDRRFTASFGVAVLGGGESLSSLMRRTDKALYEAKNSGRDCVRLAAGAAAEAVSASAPSRRAAS